MFRTVVDRLQIWRKYDSFLLIPARRSKHKDFFLSSLFLLQVSFITDTAACQIIKSKVSSRVSMKKDLKTASPKDSETQIHQPRVRLSLLDLPSSFSSLKWERMRGRERGGEEVCGGRLGREGMGERDGWADLARVNAWGLNSDLV